MKATSLFIGFPLILGATIAFAQTAPPPANNNPPPPASSNPPPPATTNPPPADSGSVNPLGANPPPAGSANPPPAASTNPPPPANNPPPPAVNRTPPPDANGAPLGPELGDQGTFVLDQISGFRGQLGGGVNYYGPVGFAYNEFNLQSSGYDLSSGIYSQSQEKIKSSSVWLAPSLDYFVANRVSIGLLLEASITWGSIDYTNTTITGTGTGGATSSPSSIPLQQTASFTFLPRIGYFHRFTDRIGIWPRVGVGYYYGTLNTNPTLPAGQGVCAASTATNPPPCVYTSTQSVSSMIFDLEVGVIYQLTDNVFLRAAPEVTFSAGGSSNSKNGVPTTGTQTQTGATNPSNSGSVLQISLTTGIGANFSL